MGGFEVLPHTADVGFRAWGADLPELFETAAIAMFSLEYDPALVPADRSVEVLADGADLEGALYGWLSELIWLHDAEGFVLASFGVSAVTEDCHIEGSARGATIGEWFVQTGPQLKAVTMHGLRIARQGEAYVATVYLDV